MNFWQIQHLVFLERPLGSEFSRWLSSYVKSIGKIFKKKKYDNSHYLVTLIAIIETVFISLIEALNHS
jgi:hypothetical protein